MKVANLAKICYGFGKLDAKMVPLESGDFDKNGKNDDNSENLANNRKRVGEKLNEITTGAPCKLARLMKMANLIN